MKSRGHFHAAVSNVAEEMAVTSRTTKQVATFRAPQISLGSVSGPGTDVCWCRVCEKESIFKIFLGFQYQPTIEGY